MRRKRRQRRAALVIPTLLVFVCAIVLILLLIRLFPPRPPVEPSAEQRISANLARGRLMPALYQAQAGALQTGWTPDLLRHAGQIWWEIGDLSQARAYWEAALRAQPGDALVARQLARVYITLEAWPQAADALTLLLRSMPDDPWVHYQLGLIAAPLDPRRAEEHLRVAARVSSYQAPADALLAIISGQSSGPALAMQVGICLAESGLWPYAEAAFRHAALLAAPYPEALAYVGLARAQQGEDGADPIGQAVALDPANPRIRYLQGVQLRLAGDLLASLDAFRLAAVLEPSNPAYAAEVGMGYQLLDNLDQAEQWLEMAVSLSGGDPVFVDLLARFRAQTGIN